MRVPSGIGSGALAGRAWSRVERWSWVEIGESVDQWLTLVQGSGSPATSADAFGGGRGLSITGLYPNPARDEVTCLLSSNRSGAVELTLYDVSGRKVREATRARADAGTSQQRLSVRGLPAGIYLVRASQGDRQAAAKLFVMR